MLDRIDEMKRRWFVYRGFNSQNYSGITKAMVETKEQEFKEEYADLLADPYIQDELMMCILQGTTDAT